MRRVLHFSHLPEVLAEARRLASSHRTLGRWTLAQICRHLADTIHGSMDGFDLRRHRFKRLFFRSLLLAYAYRWGIPEAYTVDPKLNPPEGLRLDDQIEALARAIQRYRDHTGPLQAHPLFGRLTRNEWDRMHCFHGAHHLSFVLPGLS